jgi:hypothetical protein
MKKNNVKRNFSDSDDDYGMGRKGSGSKDKAGKKRLSIYDDYEEDDDFYPHHEKFKGRRK